MGLVVRLLTAPSQSPAPSTFISPTGLAIIEPTRKWLHAAGSLSPVPLYILCRGSYGPSW